MRLGKRDMTGLAVRLAEWVMDQRSYDVQDHGTARSIYLL